MTHKLYSVTTLLGQGIPKPALQRWAAREVATYAVNERPAWEALAERDPDAAIDLLKNAPYRRTDKAATRGTDVHKVLEALALGIEPKTDDVTEPYAKQIRNFYSDHKPEVELAEATVYNLEYGYAGTLDAIVRFPRIADGLRVILDMKTTDKGPDARSRPPYPEVALQTCAYARSEFVGLSKGRMEYSNSRRYYLFDQEKDAHELMPRVEQAFVLVVSPEDYRLIPVRIDDEVWRSFLNAREVARWMLSTSRNVFGAPVEPERLAA